MGCTDKNQSMIREGRDQLFLDTADANRLNIVTANLGFDRPLTGFTDDEWRALAKKIALKPKQIRAAFERVLEITLGPQFARRNDLTTAVTAGDTIITVADASDFLQVGTMVFDKGLATEETVGFCFVDYSTNQIFLNSALTQTHAIVASGATRLLTDAAAGAPSLVVTDSSALPTTGYPYNVLVGRGTRSEEVVVVTNNDTGTNTLTLDAVTTVDHAGTSAGFVRRPLETAAPVGRDFLQFDLDDTRDFPVSGFIIVDKGLGTEEILEYKNNDVDQNILFLKTPTTELHAADASVTLLNAGEFVETVSVLQEGTYWDIYQSSPREVQIFLTEADAETLRLLDASYLHDAALLVPPSTTLLANVTAGDEFVDIADLTGFAKAGTVTIDSTETIGYVLEVLPSAPTGRLHLGRPLANSYLLGDAVDVVETPYAGTDLEEGNLRDVTGTVQPNQYSGPYLYDPLEQSVSETDTTLVTLIQPPTRVLVSQAAGFTNIEVEDASLWPAPPFTPFNVLIGRNTGADDTRAVVDRTLQVTTAAAVPGDAVTTVAGAHIIGATTLTVPAAGAAPFPDTSVPNKAGYRIIIDPGGLDETVTVLDTDGNTQFTITALTQALAGGEAVELINDVLTMDALVFPHPGDLLSPTVLGHTIEPLFTEIELVVVTGFSTTGGTVLLNFGKERTNAREPLSTASVPGLLTFVDSSSFPTTDFPYQVIVGDGKYTEEKATVTANSGTQLTISPVLTNSFAVGDYVKYISGASEVVEYQDIDATKLVFNPEIAFETRHTVGERVILSPQLSDPSEAGYDYPFLMPSDASFLTRSFFDLVRAAGVIVTIVSSR